MRIVLRADSSHRIGLGHVARCTRLAVELSRLLPDAELILVTNQPETARFFRRKQDFIRIHPCGDGSGIEPVKELQPDLAVLDLLDLEADDVQSLRGTCVVADIENVAPETSCAHLLLLRIGTLPPPGTNGQVVLAGPQYLLIDPAWALEPLVRSDFPTTGLRVFLALGGSDPSGLTSLALEACAETADLWEEVRVILGPGYEGGSPVEPRLAGKLQVFRLPPDVRGVARGMDMAVVAAGLQLFECLAAGLPCVTLRHNETQRGNAALAVEWNAAVDLGPGDSVAPEILVGLLRRLAADPDRRRSMSQAGRRNVDGLGLRRLARAIVEVLP